MRVRPAILKEFRFKLQERKKKGENQILNYLVGVAGYNRSYAARALRKEAQALVLRRKRNRALFEGDKEFIPVLKRWGELEIKEEVKEKLLRISPATIDRLLQREKKKYQLKGKARTKPGTLLKKQIPIRTFSHCHHGRPGFVEVDLVSHDGGNSRGDFCQTLDLTDVATGWTETSAVKNKAQIWVFQTLKEKRRKLLFELFKGDSDNGGEFINAHLA